MELHPGEYKELEEMAANNFTLKEIATFFMLDYREFKKAFYASESIVKRHYDRGKLISKNAAEDAMRLNAEGGNQTAYQIFERKREATELEDLKNRILYQE